MSFIKDVFGQTGPLRVDDDMKVSFQDYSLNREFALLYIDNPVGVGYSFTDDDKGI